MAVSLASSPLSSSTARAGGRPDTQLHPLVALWAVRALLANPGDTRQVFVVLRAMRGRSGARMFARFAADPAGKTLLRTRPNLLAHLTDSALAHKPEESLAHAYLRFMAAAALDSGGLAAAQDTGWSDPAPDALAFLRTRMRDQHDLLHVVTAYGADPIGELCLLAFNYAQTRHAGMAMIAVLGCLRAGFGRRGRIVRRAVLQAWRTGRRAAWMPVVDWEAALDRPLATLRAELRVSCPTPRHGSGGVSASAAGAPQMRRSLPPGLAHLGRSVLVNIAAPSLLYGLVAAWFRPGSAAPLLVCALIPIADLLIVFRRQRMVDTIAIISIVQLGVGIVITLVTGDPRLALSLHALQAGALGLVFAASVAIRQPLIRPLARQSMAGSDPERQARFDERTATPAAARTFTALTLIWAVALCAQSAGLFIASRRLPPAAYVTLSHVVGYGVNGC